MKKTHARSEGPRRPSDRRVLGALLLLLLVTFAVYAPALRSGFVTWDDPYYVTENMHVRAGLTFDTVAWAFTSTELANWHPLTWLSHMLDVALYGMKPWGHHLTSVLLHLACVFLLFAVLRRMTSAPWRSLAVAALFALHPLHVESVAWVAERKDVLSTTFWMLALWAYTRYAEKPSAGRYALVALAFGLGLMAKPMLVTLPLTLLILDLWPLRRLEGSWWPRVIEKLPLFAMSAAAALVALVTQKAAGAVGATPLATRVANAVLGYFGYLVKTFWPAKLSAFYPYELQPAMSAVALAAAVLLVITIVVWLGRRRAYLPAGWLWYLATLLPVIGLVRIGQQSMADRYTYVPLIGVFWICVWGISEMAERSAQARRIVPAVFVLLLAVFALGTRQQVGVWKNGVTLWAHARAVVEPSTVVSNNLGVALEAAGRIEDAATQYSEAIRLEPKHVRAHVNLGNARFAQHLLPQAIAAYEEALRLDPTHAQAQINLARTYYNLANATWRGGDLDAALHDYREAARWRPDDAGFHRALGIALVESGRLDEGIDTLRATLRLGAEAAATHDALANALYRRGDVAGAWREVQACRAVGGTPSPALVEALSRRMPEPAR